VVLVVDTLFMLAVHNKEFSSSLDVDNSYNFIFYKSNFQVS